MGRNKEIKNSQIIKVTRCWWLMPVILPTQEERSGRLWFEASLGK
jgi:hypothetical protein